MTPNPTTTTVTVQASEPHRGERAKKRIVLVGNPNVGKTTLFNLLTKQNARVGNYPGVTVERRAGKLASTGAHAGAEVVDVPGAYSLSARSAEEQIAIRSVLGMGLDGEAKPDLVVAVVDAGQLIRNLYFVLQLAELDVPTVVALNMIDEVTADPPLPAAITALFGFPCVPTSGRTEAGMNDLTLAIEAALTSAPRARVRVAYPGELRADVDRVAGSLPASWRSSVERDRALARWALLSIDETDELEGVDPALRAAVADVRRAASDLDLDLDRAIIGARYAFLERHAASLFTHGGTEAPRHRLTERLDRVLIHPVFGFAVFLGIMGLLFQSLFTWADPLITLVESAVSAVSEVATARLPAGVLTDLLVQGVLGGVGNVIVFVPQIVLLFLFVGLLEDSGYMARVAYLMDRVMRSLGLHGRAFVPMLSGFACAIPAILATRTMERQRDRLLTMLVVPLMTCSARLPVYTLVIAALFPPGATVGPLPVAGLLMVGMYLFATVVALIAAAVIGRRVVPGRRVPLILELPPYRVPRAEATLRMMWDKTRSFLTEAGTTILACTIVLWALLSYPKVDVDPSASPEVAAQHALEESAGGHIGRAIEPVIAPLGFDWKIGIGLVGAFAAREVFVSTLGLVYGLGEVDDEAVPLRERMRAEKRPDGKPVYTPLVGLSLMVFFALACQCMSTVAVVRRETRSYKWPAFLFGYTFVLAWVASFVVYQGGRLLGF